MRTYRFEHTSEMPCPVDRLWAFHMRPDALAVLSPPGTRVVDRGQWVADGSVVTLEVGWWPLRSTWRALHSSVRPPVSFTDVALESPFEFWAHQHTFEAVHGESSRLRDVVHYLPPRWLPRWIAGSVTRLALGALFRWRHRRTRRAVRDRACRATRPGALNRLITGGV